MPQKKLKPIFCCFLAGGPETNPMACVWSWSSTSRVGCIFWLRFAGLCNYIFRCSRKGYESRDQVSCYCSLQRDEIQGTNIWEAPARWLGKWTAAGRGASLDLGPLDLVFLEAALAANLITASISLHVAMARNPFLDPAV